ncbi:hypothetical protein PHISCL_02426 [Aspergillus sclerotialis]|uniref:Uncharacterized protein n=1 Tax=Aspergillus sclerotialis TaxID=2070753 RepID=A0A3A2ZSD0_9EURO|nr:hypothetical protein PHISCL_02426 [Aspergillus sclerotialis]
MSDSTLYLYTSLTAGSSHIVTATARVETILKANKLPFKAIDVATDDAARKLWGRKSKGKKLPGLVKFGTVVGFPCLFYTGAAADSAPTASPSTPESSAENPPKASTIKIQNPPAKESKDDSITVTMRQASEEAAAKAKDSPDTPTAKEESKPSTTETSQKNTPSDPTAEKKEDTTTQEGTEQETQNVRRKSVYPAPEIPEAEEQNVVGSRPRPPLATGSEIAAVSSDNFRADNIEALGLVEHHRGSIISATSEEERDRVASDLRKSVSGARADAIEALRHVRAESGVVDDEGDVVGEEDGPKMEAKMAVSTYLVT